MIHNSILSTFLVSPLLPLIPDIKMSMIHIFQSSVLESEEEFVQSRNMVENFQSIQQCSEMPDYFVAEEEFASIPDWSEALFAVGNIIVFISSVCGNIGALLVLYKSQMSKRSTKLFLASLAVCDLTLALSSPTVDMSQLLSRYRNWIFGELLCRVIPFIQTTAVMGVALFLVVIAVERYMYVVRAFESPTVVSPLRDIFATVTVTVVWICSLVIAIPNLWYYERKSFWTYIIVNGEQIRPRNETCKMYYVCLRSTFDHRNYAYYSFLGLAILIPTICFLYCYISIILFVRRHVNVMTARPQGAETRIARNRKTLRLILSLVFLNLFCRLPVWTFVVVTNLIELPVNTLTLLLMYSFHLLSNINSLINPFVYAIFNDSIRSTRGPNCGVPNPTGYKPEKATCCHFMTSCCYHQIKSTSLEYFGERKVKNNYDFTKNASKFIPSISTQKFNISERNEFPTFS